jgi:hypothetical protein
VKGIPNWPTLTALVGLAALTGLSFNATPAMARTESRHNEYGGGSSARYSDQYSPRGTAQRGRDDGTWDSGRNQRNGDPNNEDGDRRGNGYGDSRNGQWNQGGRWDDRNGDQQHQGRHSYRGNHGRRAHGQWARNGGWSDLGNGRNRGSCGN